MMRSFNIKHYDSFSIQGWMAREFSLKGNELLVFAFIFNVSSDGFSSYTGTLNYICESIGATKKTVLNCLSSLIKRELIIKETVIVGRFPTISYRANLEEIYF